MTNSGGKVNSGITFLNQPKIRPGISERRTEQVKSFCADIPQLLSSHQQFVHEEIAVSFLDTGVSSLVCKLESKKGAWILKMPLHSYRTTSESKFLEAWKNIGIAVPQVIEEGLFNDHSYLLMDYIDARPIGEVLSAEELHARGIFREMGEILRRMHTVAASGYGRVRDEEAPFQDFQSWIQSEDIQERISYVKEKQLLNTPEHGSISKSCEELVAYVAADPKSSYCHNDFSVMNILNTDPLTVFDPDPAFNHPHLDVARSLVLIASAKISVPQASAEFLRGYVGNDSPIDPAVLRAAVLLQAHTKFPYWHKTNQSEKIARMQKYLAEMNRE